MLRIVVMVLSGNGVLIEADVVVILAVVVLLVVVNAVLVG